jgi:hypothetical protein
MGTIRTFRTIQTISAPCYLVCGRSGPYRLAPGPDQTAAKPEEYKFLGCIPLTLRDTLRAVSWASPSWISGNPSRWSSQFPLGLREADMPESTSFSNSSDVPAGVDDHGAAPAVDDHEGKRNGSPAGCFSYDSDVPQDAGSSARSGQAGEGQD